MAHDKNDIPDSNLYIVIKVVRNEDLYQQIGRDVYFDLVDPEKVHSFQVLRSTRFHHFKEVVAEQFGVPLQLQRFWLWAKLQNETYRPHHLLTQEEETQYVYQLKKVPTKAGKLELILFLEVLQTVPNVYTLHQPHKTGEDILLFFKLYDPESAEIRYVGKLFVKGSAFPQDILKKLNDMANFAHNEEIKLYEEIKSVPTVMCDIVNMKLTFLDNQLENGDIICFQKAHMNSRYPDIPSLLGLILRCQGLLRYEGLQEAKLKVSATKDKLQKAEEKVIAIKVELKEAEANVGALEAMMNS
ncbi:hypothetical protein C5167_030962 [Papaver somniferum]|uniref:ubiquitin carboxyl-terminal hydrolase 13-like n=1 Tax=Papaver somniferum TaxID=3469 RepID=UPI000E6F5F34|nr:ubiquitin carboxyl-terminal hydrolase 13-like [Papaver somniferum]RZC89267.1 hypothetical protein C5167_030962 [Papaver somniferum]